MKFGVRKPSIKKSFKARTTGRAKRTIKKAVVPGYGQKGAGWVKNPKRAAYNKVYNKTSVGISDLSKGSSGKTSSTRNSVSHSTATKQNSTSTPRYVFLLKEKPNISTPIIFFVISLIFFTFSKFWGTLFATFAVYFLYDYVHRTKKEDYVSAIDFSQWEALIRKYKKGVTEPLTYSKVTKYSAEILNEAYSKLTHCYDLLSNKDGLTQKQYKEIIVNSNIIMDFKKFVSYKTSDVRLLPDRVIAKRATAGQKYIDLEYQKAVEHAKSLKTDAGKLNQIEKFKSSITENLKDIYPEYSEYMSSKISTADFVTEQ